MQFKIMSPMRSQEFEVNWINVSTDQGSFIVEKGHAPTIVMLSLDKDIIIELEDGTEKSIPASGGILEVEREYVTLLVSQE